ncbi:MAG: prepilin-type N-terminal cleavage/methylation domain-containing protein, partial [Clostridiales Family XIII bacterium]|nr:prepilin-type N-terminal cleavage/methylation domain-containing protein [Clostridiales Family XIII bacterium]
MKKHSRGVGAAFCRPRRSRKGFTLVEIIVALVIGAIVVAAAGSFLVYGTNFLGQTERKASDKQIAEDAADYIRNVLVYAKEIKVIRAEKPPAQTQGGALLYIGGDDGSEIACTGRLFYRKANESVTLDVLGEAFRCNALALSYSASVDEKSGTKSFQVRV